MKYFFRKYKKVEEVAYDEQYRILLKEPFSRPIAMLAPVWFFYDIIHNGYRCQITTYKTYVGMWERRKRELENCGWDYSKTMFHKIGEGRYGY